MGGAASPHACAETEHAPRRLSSTASTSTPRPPSAARSIPRDGRARRRGGRATADVATPLAVVAFTSHGVGRVRGGAGVPVWGRCCCWKREDATLELKVKTVSYFKGLQQTVRELQGGVQGGGGGDDAKPPEAAAADAASPKKKPKKK